MNAPSLVYVTDNRSLFDALKSTKQVTEKRLRLEISSIKELIQSKKIKEMFWSDTKGQLADCLTKKGASALVLLKALSERLWNLWWKLYLLRQFKTRNILFALLICSSFSVPGCHLRGIFFVYSYWMTLYVYLKYFDRYYFNIVLLFHIKRIGRLLTCIFPLCVYPLTLGTYVRVHSVLCYPVSMKRMVTELFCTEAE